MVPKLILVEPGAFLLQGHYREKLILWVKALQSVGRSISVICWEAPSGDFLADIEFVPVPILVRKVASLFPHRLYVLWAMFWTYFFAFQKAVAEGSSVLGLTTSTLLPVAAARAAFRSHTLHFGQILMYGNSFDTVWPWRARMARWSLLSLLRSGAAILPNTKRTQTMLASQVESPALRSRIVTVYDPVYLAKKPAPDGEKPLDRMLLVPGLDDTRRTPLAHLEAGRLDPAPLTLHIHASALSDERTEEIRARVSALAGEAIISSTYLDQEGLFDLFASASCSLLAYKPSLSQGSGFLVQSIVSGTPVLCSRFPHAEEIFAEFGRLGELFEFENMDDFRSAWARLRKWGANEWAQFHTARTLLMEQVNYENIARSTIRILETESDPHD